MTDAETPWSSESFVKLDITELRALAALDPDKLLRWLGDSGSEFIFGVELFPAEDWGGRVRITINRNVELHLVSGPNEAMPELSDWPRFSLAPALTAEAGHIEDLGPLEDSDSDDSDGDADPLLAGEAGNPRSAELIFHVDPAEFGQFLQDAVEVVQHWRADPADPRAASFPFLPESEFRDRPLLQWIRREFMTHERIIAEGRFDGRLGYPRTPPAVDETLEDIPPPVITDTEEDEEWLGRLEAETSGRPAPEPKVRSAFDDDTDDDIGLSAQEHDALLEQLEQDAIEERRRQEGY